MIIKNYTPHPIMFYKDGDCKLTIQPESETVRIDEYSQRVDSLDINGFYCELVTVTNGPKANLPTQVTGTYLIVSRMVAQAYPYRSDLLVPYDLVRDENGTIIGCSSFATFASVYTNSNYRNVEKNLVDSYYAK